MGTLQDALNAKQDNLRRHLFDRNIQITGRQYEAIRITVQEMDMYGDALEGSSTLEGRVPLTLSITYPAEIPINRFRYVNSADSAERTEIESTGSFFFEVLPVEVYSKFTDNIETGDFLLHTAEDETGNKMVCVLQTSELLGTFGRSLVWKKHYASPFKGTLPDAVLNIVEELTS